MRNPILCVLLIALAVPVLRAQEDDASDKFKASEAASRILESHQARIGKELRGLPNHAWAGAFYYGDGLGVNVHLTLAPEAGFAFTWHGCLGRYDLNYGSVKWADGLLHLAPELPNRHRGFEGMSTELVPIVWGDRHYLIGADQFVDFANAFNSGAEPSKGFHSRFLLREGDAQKPVRGKPPLPPQYQKYLLDRPIAARVAAVGATVRQNEYVRVVTIVVDKGRMHGLLPGMELYTTGSVPFDSATVTRVGETSAEAELRVDKDAKVLPAIGWALSTSYSTR